MTENSGRFRSKRVYFSQVSNSALRDDSLSLRAKGLYALIQSYITIEDFVLYKSFLMKQCIEGVKAFEKAWKELKDAGYLIQHKLRTGKGVFVYEYELLDVKSDVTADNFTSEPHPLLAGMEKAVHGKRVSINNTVINNTDNNNTYSDIDYYSDIDNNTDIIDINNIKEEVTDNIQVTNNNNLPLKNSIFTEREKFEEDFIEFDENSKNHKTKYIDIDELIEMETAREIAEKAEERKSVCFSYYGADFSDIDDEDFTVADECIDYFYDAYEDFMGCDHPRYSGYLLRKIYTSLISYIHEFALNEYEIKEIIKAFFEHPPTRGDMKINLLLSRGFFTRYAVKCGIIGGAEADLCF